MFIDSTRISNPDENHIEKPKIRLKMSKKSIKSILQRKDLHHEYIKHVVEYPKIMEYILNDNTDCINIPLRHLEPFIKEHVS